jgi:hypothetical protein
VGNRTGDGQGAGDEGCSESGEAKGSSTASHDRVHPRPLPQPHDKRKNLHDSRTSSASWQSIRDPARRFHLPVAQLPASLRTAAQIAGEARPEPLEIPPRMARPPRGHAACHVEITRARGSAMLRSRAACA